MKRPIDPRSRLLSSPLAPARWPARWTAKGPRTTSLPLLLLGLTLLALTPGSRAGSLADGFVHPPPSARPWVYWFPLDGNITSNGITLDLEAMKRVGIGGVLYMETDQGAPRGPAKFAGPQWRDLFKHICAEAHRLGLEVNVNNDAGWCGSGGPWITPELSMQHVVWAETNFTGPATIDCVLARPRATANYYRDIALFAFPTPAGSYRIPHVRGKSGDVREEIAAQATFATLPAEAVVARQHLTNLTSSLDPNGHLRWQVPAGRWTLLRLGHTSTGKDNHPAPIDGRGLECDKFSREAIEVMFDGLMGKLIADSRPFAGRDRTLVSTHIDSWEVGSQNWSPRFREEFQKRRGYDVLPWLPVLAGHVVESLEASERFLWDMRQTVNDLIVSVYAGHFQELAHRHGLRLSIEAYDGSPTDDMAYAGKADEPMAEFWSWAKFGAAYSCTEMASSAHVYGKPILGAEAFTATDAEKWLGHPATIKELGDWAFCEGVNRFVFHRYALQPWDDVRPGMSMGPWGLHYERTQTWWEQSRAWHEYLARCQYLLQQGLFVADLCFLAPEASPQQFKSPVKSGHDRPGYNFDGCPADALLTRTTVRNGRLTFPDGLSYRLLVLPRTPTMTPKLLGKIRDLVKAGATVLGAPPRKSPSLQNYPQCDREVQALARELWGDGPAPAELTARTFGRGQVIWGQELVPVDSLAETAPPLAGTQWIWVNEGRPAQSAPPGDRHFRRLVTVPEDDSIVEARLRMTADNSFACWINGQLVAEGDNFNQLYTLNIAGALKPGQNLVAVRAVNGATTPNPAGLIGVLTIRLRRGGELIIPTDARWEAAANASGGWSPALQLGPPGMAPWGEIGESSTRPDPIPDIGIATRQLEKMGVPPDFRSETSPGSQRLRFIHKRIGSTDVYFVANPNPRAEEAVCTFRVDGRAPRLWWPDTGKMARPAIYDLAAGTTRLPLRLDPNGSVFVIFPEGERDHQRRIVSVTRDGQSATASSIELNLNPAGRLQALAWQPGQFTLKTAQGRERSLVVPAPPAPLEISGPWTVRFDPKWGGPAAVTFDELGDWSKHADPGIRHYSGTAVYQKTFNVTPAPAAGERFFLDLGRVSVMAEVRWNNRDLGILWKPPFRVEVTEALRPGENTLELRVVNLWVNRQIGDEQLPDDSERNPDGTLKRWPAWLAEGKASPTGRHTFTSWRLWKKDSALQESGLLGPVRVVAARQVGVAD